MTSHIFILGPQEATAHWSVSTCHRAPVAQSLLMCSVHQSALVPQGWQDLSHPLPSPAFFNSPPTPPPPPPLTPHHFAQGNFPSCQFYRCSFLKLGFTAEAPSQFSSRFCEPSSVQNETIHAPSRPSPVGPTHLTLALGPAGQSELAENEEGMFWSMWAGWRKPSLYFTIWKYVLKNITH